MICAEERCAAVLSTMAQGVVFHDLAGRIESCNGAAEKLFGLTSDRMVGRTWMELGCVAVHEDGSPFSSDQHPAMVTLRIGKALSNIVLGLHKPNGTLTWISVDTRPLLQGEGKLCGVLAIFNDISGQKLAEAALQDSEERFREIIEGAVEGIYRTSPGGRILAANTAMAEILGYSSTEEVINTITDVSHQVWLDPNERSTFVGILEEYGLVRNYECQFRRKDGASIWVSANSRRVRGRDGNTVWYEGFIQDVTERKLTENKLRESEVRLRLALEATSDGVWERHIPSGNMFFSPRYYATLGYEPHEFEASFGSWETYVHAEDLPRVKAALVEHFTQQKEYNIEFRLRHKSGEWLWVLSRGRVVEWDAQGCPVRMVGTYSDISARKLSEQKLQESERRLRALYDGAPLGIAVADSNTGRLLQVNPAYCRITGRASEELCGTDLQMRTHPDDIPPQLDYLRRLRAGEIPGFQMDKRYLRPDGSIVWASLRVVPLWESGASPTFHLSMVEEITARKQAEESLRERNNYIDTILGNAPIGFAVITVPDGRIVFAGSKFEEIHGLPHGSVATIGGLFDAFQIDLDSRAEIHDQVTADIASGHPSPMSWENIPITTAAGEHKFVTISQIPIPTQNLLVCTAQDATERKRAEDALTSNEAKMQSIVNSAMDAIISVNEQQRIVVFNHAAEEIFRCAASEALGSSLDRFIPAEQREAHHKHIRQFGVNGRTQCFAPAARGLMAVRADGERFPIEIAVSRVQAGGERLYTAILRDISERKRAEETLRTSEEGLRLLGDNLPNSLVFQYTREPDGTPRFLYISAGVERLYGVKAEDVLKDAGVLQRQLLPEGLSAVLEAEQVGGRDFPVFEREVQVQLPDGRLRWMHILSRPRRLPDGRTIWDGVETDITERRLAEQKLRRSEEQMRALAARVQSVAEEERLRISRELHDQLGQSLTAIKMELDWLARKHGAGEEVMVEQVRDAMQLVDSTIGLVRRLSTELRPATLDTFGLSAALEFQVEEFQRRTGIQCSVEMTQGRLDLSPEQRIAVFRICQEALTNVVRHAGASRVHLTLEEAGGHTVFTVKDDGKGFPIESLDHKGALGILGMRERAIMLGGVLEIQSAPGAGTEITLRIPLPVGTVEAERT